MVTTAMTPKKPCSNEELLAKNGGRLVSLSGFPFFLSRMRDDLDQILARPSPSPSASEGHGIVIRPAASGHDGNR
jgi:hypothetical protein